MQIRDQKLVRDDSKCNKFAGKIGQMGHKETVLRTVIAKLEVWVSSDNRRQESNRRFMSFPVGHIVLSFIYCMAIVKVSQQNIYCSTTVKAMNRSSNEGRQGVPLTLDRH
jgi:hypothetical protein